MAWNIRLKPTEIISINGCRVQAASSKAIKIRVLDHAEVILPSGELKLANPKSDILDNPAARP